jgi:hypothetical protein
MVSAVVKVPAANSRARKREANAVGAPRPRLVVLHVPLAASTYPVVSYEANEQKRKGTS